jgi:hypothetical protein
MNSVQKRKVFHVYGRWLWEPPQSDEEVFMKHIFRCTGIIAFMAIIVLALAGCPDAAGGGGGGGGEDPEITWFDFTPESDLEEGSDNVTAGRTAGTFINPEGGTPPYTYSIIDGDPGFSIDGTDLKIAGPSPLTQGSYSVTVKIVDSKGKEFARPVQIDVTSEGGGGEDEYLNGSVSITGRAVPGETLTANIASLEGTGTPKYQWQRTAGEYFWGADDENISGANQQTYQLTDADGGKKVRVQVGRTGYYNNITSDPKTVYAGLPAKPAASPNGGPVSIGSIIDLSSVTPGVHLYYTDNGTDPDPVNEVGQAIGSSLPITKACTIKVVAAYRGDIEIVSDILEVSFTVTSPPSSLTWSAVTGHGLAVENSIIGEIAFGNGKFVALATGKQVAYTSNNGDSWSKSDSLALALGSSGVMDLVFVNGKFFVLGTNAQMAYSEDGAAWTGATIGGDIFKYDTDATLNEELMLDDVCGLAFGSGVYVAAGQKGTIAYSPDLVTWTSASGRITNGDDETINRTIAYANGKFILGRLGGIKYSGDGTTWQDAVNPDHAAGNKYIAIVYGGPAGQEQFYALCDGGVQNSVFSSTDGTSWTKVLEGVRWSSLNWRTGFPSGTTALAAGGGRLVVVDTAGDIFWSDDKGVNWLAQDYEQTGVFISSTRNNIAIRDIAYGNGVFIAVGGGSPSGTDIIRPGTMAVSNLHEARE